MSANKGDDKDFTGEERIGRRLPIRPPVRVIQASSSRDVEESPAINEEAIPRRSKRKATSGSGSAAKDTNTAKVSKPAPKATRKQTQAQAKASGPVEATLPSATRVQLNIGDMSTWSPEMHRQYRLIQAPMALLERIWERPALPAGFHRPPQRCLRPGEQDEVQRLEARHPAAAPDAPGFEAMGTGTEGYERMTSGDSAADSEMFNVDVDLETFLAAFPEEQQEELLRMALALKREREGGEVDEEGEGNEAGDSGKGKAKDE